MDTFPAEGDLNPKYAFQYLSQPLQCSGWDKRCNAYFGFRCPSAGKVPSKSKTYKLFICICICIYGGDIKQSSVGGLVGPPHLYLYLYFYLYLYMWWWHWMIIRGLVGPPHLYRYLYLYCICICICIFVGDIEWSSVDGLDHLISRVLGCKIHPVAHHRKMLLNAISTDGPSAKTNVLKCTYNSHAPICTHKQCINAHFLKFFVDGVVTAIKGLSLFCWIYSDMASPFNSVDSFLSTDDEEQNPTVCSHSIMIKYLLVRILILRKQEDGVCSCGL